MANNDIIVSEMTPASQINTGDLMIMTQPDAQSETGYSTKSGTVLQVSNKMLKGTNYETDLPSFTNKNVLGGMEELKGDIFNLLPVDEASGSIANFETELAAPLQSLLVDVVATQPSGTPTPSTPLPITGYSSANITRCGKNIGQSVNLSAAVIPGGYRAISGGTSLIAFVESGKTYTVSGVTANRDVCAYFDHVPQENDETPNGENIPISSPSTFTATHTGFALIYVNNGTVDTSTAQVENGNQPTTYTPYNGQTYAIAFGQTVYGGVLDVTRGKLSVTHGKFVLDNTATASQFEINTYTDRNRINYVPYVSAGKLNGTFKADKLETVPNASGGIGTGNYQIFGSTNSPRMWITVPTTIATVADFLTYISSNPIEVVYELATPFDIDLTPEVILAIVGTNNVFADCGGVEVKFKDSIQHYIDKKIAQTQALIL